MGQMVAILALVCASLAQASGIAGDGFNARWIDGGFKGRVASPSSTAFVSFDNVSAVSTTSGATTYTVSHTSAGSYMVVGITMSSPGGTVWAVSYGGAFATRRQFQTQGTVTSEQWTLASPEAGTRNLVVYLITGSSPGALIMGVTTFNNATAVSGFAGSVGNTSPASVTVTSLPTSMVVDNLAFQSAGSTATGNLTERWNLQVGAGATRRRGAGQTATGAASVGMNWVLSGAGNWAECALSVDY